MLARLLTAAWLAVAAAIPASAEPVTLGGITFSDELGGVVLHQGWGAGTRADPFVLVEEITDDGPAVLVVRGLRSNRAGYADGQLRPGIVVRKIVTNATARDWFAFELELRENLETSSNYEDGLSFGQALATPRPFTNDRYGRVQLTDEPLDAVVFSDGLVQPGEVVTVTVTITDYTPQDEFFFLQRRDSPVVFVPGPPPG
jgi:hypothetical protein